MKRCVAGAAAALTAGALIAFAPPASAGCEYGGMTISKCDGPVEPDGTWQRCATFSTSTGPFGGYRPDVDCQRMGPDQHPWGMAFQDPPTHIDD